MARTYRVTGRTATLGHDPGSVFRADIPKEQEARLLARGALERVTEQPRPEAPKQKPGDLRPE